MSEKLLEKNYNEKIVHLGSFWGGKEKKRCVQLTVTGKGELFAHHCQMTLEEAKKFFRGCVKVIEKIERRYNKNPPWWEELCRSRRKKS